MIHSTKDLMYNETIISNHPSIKKHIHKLYLPNCVEIYSSFKYINVDEIIAPKLKNISLSFNYGNIITLTIPNCINIYKSFINTKIEYINNDYEQTKNEKSLQLTNVYYSFINLIPKTKIINKNIQNCINSFTKIKNINYITNKIKDLNECGYNNIFNTIKNKTFNSLNGFYNCLLSTIEFNNPWCGIFYDCVLNSIKFNNCIINSNTFLTNNIKHIVFNKCMISINSFKQCNIENLTLINCMCGKFNNSIYSKELNNNPFIISDINNIYHSNIDICDLFDLTTKNIKLITSIDSMTKYNELLINVELKDYIDTLKLLGLKIIDYNDNYVIFDLNHDIKLDDYFIKHCSHVYDQYMNESENEIQVLNTIKQHIKCDKINIYKYVIDYFEQQNQSINKDCNEIIKIKNDLLTLQSIVLVKLLEQICGINSFINTFIDIN